MLESIRKYSSSLGVKILYGLLALSFALFFVAPGNDPRVNVVAEVQGERITRQQLDNQTALLERRFAELLRGAALPRGFDLRSQALDSLVDDALFAHEAHRLGLVPTETDVIAAIQEMPELQEDGRFNRELLQRVLELNRDRGEFEAQVRQDLMNRRVRALVTDGVQVTDSEVEARYALEREQVDLRYVRVDAAALAEGLEPGDEELAKYLADNADRYRTPPRVRARYVAYRPADFADEAAPSDADVVAYYDRVKDDHFAQPEEVRARHILVAVAADADEATRVAASKKADDLLAKAKGGADFALLAKESSDDPGSKENGGDLGFFPRGRMVPEFDAVAFTLEPGQVSEIVESPFGLHIIKVEEKREDGAKPLEEVREQIVRALTDERAMELAHEQARTDRRAVVLGKKLSDAVGDRKVEETPPFAADATIPGVGRIEAFNDAAFALSPDQPSDLIEEDDVVYLLEPIERLEPAVPPLDEVRDTVKADVVRTTSERLAREKADQILTRAREIGFDAAAAEGKLPVEETGPFERRSGVVPKLAGANDLRNDAFALTPESPLGPKVYPVGSDAVVVALKERTPADMQGFADAKDGLRQQLLQERQAETVTAFVTYLKERAQAAGALAVNADAVGGEG
ncbi:MAG: peptidylprolyl isomerase [bacterium]|nr:peptidylprolyl isomerase [bacterium]